MNKNHILFPLGGKLSFEGDMEKFRADRKSFMKKVTDKLSAEQIAYTDESVEEAEDMLNEVFYGVCFRDGDVYVVLEHTGPYKGYQVVTDF